MSAYEAFLIGAFTVVVIGIFKGAGANRSIVVFADYDDLGLSILIPASFFLISLLFRLFGGSPAIGMIIGAIVALWLMVILIKNTYIANGSRPGPTALALVTKIPLSVIWFISLVSTLNPSGTGRQRTSNRALAMLILALLTPILALLVVDKSGSTFNPRNWIKGRRVGSVVRSNL